MCGHYSEQAAMSDYYPGQSSGLMSRRMGAFVAIVFVHILVIWAFISGLATSGAKYVQTILQTNIIETQKKNDLPPPPPPVDLKEHPPVQVIAPEISINIPVEPPPVTVPKPVAAPPPRPPPPPPPPPTKIQVTYRPDVEDYYPDAARRANQEGRAIVKLCISDTGKIDSAEIATTSGFPMLDEAAIKVGKAFRFKPPTQAGKPIAICEDLPVKFELHAG
jgi:protein TonB